MEPIEQQVYGSLAIRTGHHTYQVTPGIDKVTSLRHETICDRWGKYESGPEFGSALLQIPLWEGASLADPPTHHLVILVTDQGRDAAHRPGAMLCHIVRIPASTYARVDFNPFLLQRQLTFLRSWGPERRVPDLDIAPRTALPEDLAEISPARYKLLRIVLGRLLDAGELRLPAAIDSRDVERTFAEVYGLLPVSVRPWFSLATFAFTNPGDFNLVAYRTESGDFQRSLTALQSDVASPVWPEVEGYLARLFDALQRQDWAAAQDMIRQTQLPPPPVRPHPKADVGSPTEDVEADAREADNLRPAQWTAATSRHTGRSGAARRRRPSSVLLFLGALALIGVGAFGLRYGGGNGKTSNGRLLRVEAPTTHALVDGFERSLGGMIKGGTRDIEIRESMRESARDFDQQILSTAQAEGADPSGRLAAASGGGLIGLASALQAAAENARDDQRRVMTLKHVLEHAEAAELRTAYNDTTGLVDLSRFDAPAADSLQLVFASRAEALAQSAAGVRLLAEANAESGSAERWSAACSRLRLAAAAFPATLGPAPPAVMHCLAVCTSLVEIHEVEPRLNLAARAAGVPYDASVFLAGGLTEPARTLVAGVAGLEASGVVPGGTLGQTAAFYKRATDPRIVRLSNLDSRGAREVLAELVGVCPEPCLAPGYGPHLARWKLEAWRYVSGGPGGENGRAVQQELGTAAFPGGNRVDLDAMVAILPRLESAANPAPAALIESVERTSNSLSTDLYQKICRGWLARNSKRTADLQRTFEQLYERLRTQAINLRAANEASAPEAYASLRRTAAEIDDLDLQQLKVQPEFAARITAVTELSRALSVPCMVPIERIDVQLLRTQDYGGTTHSEARPQLQIGIFRNGQVTPLFERPWPAMPAIGGTGFEERSVAVKSAIRCRPDDVLLVKAREPGGDLWFHLYVRPVAHGHVAAALAGVHQVRVPASVMTALASRPDAVPPPGDGGETVASLRVVLGAGFWSELNKQLPDVP